MLKYIGIFALFLLISGHSPFPGKSIHFHAASAQTNSIADDQNKNNSNSKPKKDSSNIETPTLFDTVKQGGGIMIPILLLGLLSLTLIIERILFFWRTGSAKKEKLWEVIDKAKGNSDARFREELQDELDQAVNFYIQKMERGVPLINGIGNVAPILGFFGTVVGMIEAFAAIAAATTVNAKVVAVGIQIALVTTAGGLAIAVPSIFFYHVFMHIIHKSYAQADVIISEQTDKLPRLTSEIDNRQQ